MNDNAPMNDTPAPLETSDDPLNGPWVRLRAYTAARIGLARSGASLATKPLLDFRLAHARARDAVHAPLDQAKMLDDLKALEFDALGVPIVTVASAVARRTDYLVRPDLGRMLSADADAVLAPHRGTYDIALVVTDGLSAPAVQVHAAPVLALTVPLLIEDGWRVAPLVVARHGRVAIGDAVANALNANIVAVLIGERPGLSAPDSMGAYLTFAPGPQTTDADRNCISNIRPDGIPYGDAAFKLGYLLREMRQRKLSGYTLKDDSDRLLLDPR
jgi:ethanolamine ammonia-lyase small subunit